MQIAEIDFLWDTLTPAEAQRRESAWAEEAERRDRAWDTDSTMARPVADVFRDARARLK